MFIRQWTCKIIFCIYIIFAGISGLKAQDFWPYIHFAFENNALLKSRNFDLKSAEVQYLNAKSAMGPNVTFLGQYTLASGGREIAFPVGDLLNPVYSSLNLLTGSNAFPQIENVNEQFFPNDFYDAKIRLIQPIFYPDIRIQKNIKKSVVDIKALEVKAFKRLLAKDLTQALVKRQSLHNSQDIIRSSIDYLDNLLRLTDKMIINGVALPSARKRLESEKLHLLQEEVTVISGIQNIDEYLLFLLGAPMVGIDALKYEDIPTLSITDDGIREEHLTIEKAIEIQDLAYKKEQNFYLPRVSAVLDAGTQDFGFGWAPYVLGVLNVEINIFDNKRLSYRKKDVEHQKAALIQQSISTDQRLEMQKIQLRHSFDNALKQLKQLESQISIAQSLYQDIEKQYQAGSSGYLELLDAQQNYTQIRLQKNILISELWHLWAEYQYIVAALLIE